MGICSSLVNRMLKVEAQEYRMMEIDVSSTMFSYNHWNRQLCLGVAFSDPGLHNLPQLAQLCFGFL